MSIAGAAAAPSAALKRVRAPDAPDGPPRVTMRLTLKETAGMTPLQIAAMRVQLLNDEMKWVAPPDMLLGAGAGHRTAAQLYLACKQAWCIACQQRVSAEPANNCRAHGKIGVDSKHARSYASLMEKAAGLQPTMHAFAVHPAAVDGSAAAGGGGGGGGQASGVPVSPIPFGSKSAPVRQMHAEAVKNLRELETCNLLGLGVNPHLVRYAARRCAAVPSVLHAAVLRRAARARSACDSHHGAARVQIRAALHSDTVSGRAIRTLLERNVALGTMVPDDSVRGDAALDDEIKRLVKGKYGTLVTDGATFRHWKVIVVLFVSPQLEEPVLVSVIVPEAGVGVAEGARAGEEEGADDEEEDYSYRAPSGALDVRAGMTRIELLDEFITCVMGDNVTFYVSVHSPRRGACVARHYLIARLSRRSC